MNDKLWIKTGFAWIFFILLVMAFLRIRTGALSDLTLGILLLIAVTPPFISGLFVKKTYKKTLKKI